MIYELTQRFYFEAAHTLVRQHDAETSRRIHGHTYLAEITVVGQPETETGMVVDLAALRRAADEVREKLDHQFLDDLPGLGPATLENLCAFVWRHVSNASMPVASITIRRAASGDRCTLRSSQ